MHKEYLHNMCSSQGIVKPQFHIIVCQMREEERNDLSVPPCVYNDVIVLASAYNIHCINKRNWANFAIVDITTTKALADIAANTM